MPAFEGTARLRAGVPALAPLAALYGAGVAIARRRGLARRGRGDGGVRVISVGNLEAGGNGKTPLAIHLLEAGVERGLRVGYVSRGYGGRAARARHVTVVAGEHFPAGAGGVHVLDARPGIPVETWLGDEAALVHERVPAARVAIASDKRRALAVAQAMGAEVVIVDDAFQSWAMPRDLDVVLLDAGRPLAGGRLLPAGTLREAPAALGRAQVVIFNGAEDDAAVARGFASVSAWLQAGATVAGMRRDVSVGDTAGGRVLVACAVARPERFAADVAAMGWVVAGTRAFPDHHAYRQSDVAAIEAAARAGGAAMVVVTEKDWMKLRRLAWSVPVRVARLRVELVGVDVAALLGA